MRRKPEGEVRDRRRYSRFVPRWSRSLSSAGEARIIDISPTGLGLAIHPRNGLAPGDRYLVMVEDRHGHGFEALAELRWRSEIPDWHGGYRAGFAFVSVLSDDPDGTWAGVMPDPDLEAGGRISWLGAVDEVDDGPRDRGATPTGGTVVRIVPRTRS